MLNSMAFRKLLVICKQKNQSITVKRIEYIEEN